MDLIAAFDSKDFLSGCAGGIAGVLASHPLDTIKVRVQSQGSVNIPTRYYGSLHCATDILKTEGIRGLYKGVIPPIAMQAFINAIVFGTERATSNFLRPKFAEGPWKEMAVGICAGSAAGFTQTVVCAPMELVKLRTQHQAIGEAARYQGNLATLRDILRRGGIRGCYQGFWITALRDTPAFGVYFAVYEGLMHYTARKTGTDRKDLSVLYPFIHGGCAGVASWVVNYPVDLVKTRIQLDGANGAVRQFSSSWDCFKQLLMEGGIRGLFRGLGPTVVRAFVFNSALFPVVEATVWGLNKLY